MPDRTYWRIRGCCRSEWCGSSSFAFRPVNFILFYLFVDGVFRAYFTLAGEVYGTFVLHVVGWVHQWIRPRYVEKSLGPRVPDRVQWAEGKIYDLLIGSCRRKPRWDHLITIRYQDRLYQVIRETSGLPPFHFHYELRRNPQSRVTRKIYDYDSDEVLNSNWKVDEEVIRKYQ